jgi:glycosyltransferase domain-containing protein
MKLKKNCSILIITHNRHQFLLNILNYYKKKSKKIIILDSSNKKNKFVNSAKYFHLPNYSLIDKIKFGLAKTNSKYVVISSDDDFFVIKSLNKGVNFLEKNKDYVSVLGKFVFFQNFKKKISFRDATYINKSFNQKNAEDRINKSLTEGHSQMFYSIFRRKLLLKIFKQFKNFHSLNFHEYISMIFLLLFGKHKFFDITWMLRDGTVNTNYKIANRKVSNNRIIKIDKSFFNSEYYKKFIKILNKENLRYNFFSDFDKLKSLIDNYFKRQIKLKHIRYNFFESYKTRKPFFLTYLKGLKFDISLINKYKFFKKMDIKEIKVIEDYIYKIDKTN